jgi:hypothetical protein
MTAKAFLRAQRLRQEAERRQHQQQQEQQRQTQLLLLQSPNSSPGTLRRSLGFSLYSASHELAALTAPLPTYTCSVTGFSLVNDHGETHAQYTLVIRAQLRAGTEAPAVLAAGIESWTLHRRFREFAKLHKLLARHHAREMRGVPLPKQTSVFQHNPLDPAALAARRIVLDNYLQSVLAATPLMGLAYELSEFMAPDSTLFPLETGGISSGTCPVPVSRGARTEPPRFMLVLRERRARTNAPTMPFGPLPDAADDGDSPVPLDQFSFLPGLEADGGAETAEVIYSLLWAARGGCAPGPPPSLLQQFFLQACGWLCKNLFDNIVDRILRGPFFVRMLRLLRVSLWPDSEPPPAEAHPLPSAHSEDPAEALATAVNTTVAFLPPFLQHLGAEAAVATVLRSLAVPEINRILILHFLDIILAALAPELAG